MRSHRRRRRMGSRLKVATLAGGLALLLSVSASIVNAREPDDGDRGASSAGRLFTPKIDPEGARRAAVGHLMSLGVPRDQARRRIQKQPGQIRAAAALRKQAPESVQSLWIDGKGTLRAGVLNKAGVRAARAAGATPKRVAFSMKELEAARDTLAMDVMKNPPRGFRSASFEIDPAGGKLVARYMFEGADRVVPAVPARFGDMVTASAEDGELRDNEDIDIAGAGMSSTEGANAHSVCTAAWAVDIADPNGGTPGNGVMTAGHCFNDGDPRGTKYDIDTTAAGNTQATGEFFVYGKGGDYGYLRLERDRGTTKLDQFGVNRAVEAIKEPVPGVTVCKEGAVTYETCGEITRVGITQVRRQEGVGTLIGNQVRATYCSESGDSGAPVYMDFPEAQGPSGIAAVGIHGGSKRAAGKCESSFTPLSVVDKQNKFHVRIDGG